jgi:small-conductance mechanosensitive channel
VSNVVSGVLILMYRPFRLGDTINVTGSEGVVINIDLRYTVLQAEGKVILIPNQNVFSNTVVVNRPQLPAHPQVKG